jgi:2-polyprenyl-3-methyl-5-hydroxy-6-metoxy-1,4-benzoquinol methylase
LSRKIWNRLAEDFEVAVCDVTRSSGRQVAELVRRTKPSRQQTLIDAGCGIGSFSRRFGRRFGSLIAFDFAAKMVARAKDRCPAAIVATWMTLGLEDAAAKIGPLGDFVACLNVITSTDADLRRRQWESLAGLVRPSGYALIVVPSLESALRVVEFADPENRIHASEFASGIVFRGEYQQKHYSREELRATVTDEGLRIVSLKRIHYPWSDDGVDDPGRTPPWSWVVLARKRTRSGTNNGHLL